MGKKKLTITMNSQVCKKLILIFPIALFSVFIACNNEPKKENNTVSTEDTSKTKQEDSSKVQPFGQFDLNSLTLTAQQQKDLFQNGNSVKQIVFTFDNRGVKGWGLKASGTTKDGKVLSGPFDLAIVPSTNIPFPANGAIVNQIITRGNLKDFYGLTGEIGKDRKIDESKFKDIRFTPSPVLGGGKAIFFIVTYDTAAVNLQKMHKTFTAGDIITNPSPPAPPACLTDCDN